MIKILIVDDEVDFCFFLKSTLELNPVYRVFTSSDGKAGINTARRVQPDLILLDIMMPGMNGFQVLDRLKKNKKTAFIPVVMLTAIDTDKSIKKAVTSYCDDYIVKPVEMDVLESKIEHILSLSPGRKAHA